MLKKLVAIGCMSAVLLTACGGSTGKKIQITYQIIDRATNQGTTVETIKPILEKRLAKLDVHSSSVSIDHDNLLVNIEADDLDTSRALSVAYQYDLTLEEARQELTSTEMDQVAAYNQKQKEILKTAYTKAQENNADMDSIVTSYSERMNHLDRGMKGPLTASSVSNAKYWEALNQTAAGQFTPIVESANQVVFAKVIDKPTATQIRFQEVIRFLQLPEPYLGYSPILHLGQYISNAEVVKKDPKDTYNPKNYLVKVTLNEAGKIELAKTSQQYQGKPLKLFIDHFPTADITFATTNNDGWILIDGNFNETKATETAKKLSMTYMPALLSMSEFKKQ